MDVSRAAPSRQDAGGLGAYMTDKNKIIQADLDDPENSDTNPNESDSGESLFDDLSPRFVRSLDAAVAKETGKRPPKADLEEEEDETAKEDLDESDEDEAEEVAADEEAEEEEPADEDADEPRRGKPSKFEKRLSRADRLLDEVRTQNAELAARLNDREQKDKLAADTTEFNSFKAKTDSELERLKEELVAATENGETKKQIDLQDKITDLKADLRGKLGEFERAKAAIEESSKRRQISPIVATKVNQWKRRNPRYSTDPAFAEAVNGLDASLVRSGSDNESDEHYKELDRRIAKLYPELAPRVKKPQRRHPSSQPSRDSSPGPRRSPGDAQVRVKGNKLSTSPAKLERIKINMARFNMEPTPANIKEYVQNNPGI